MTRSDENIKKDIVDELYWDSRIDAARIHVDVDKGTVKLSGEVGAYSDLAAACSSAWSIEGVINVVEDLQVTYATPPVLPTDSEIETHASNVLAWEPAIDETTIQVSVSGRSVTIEGTVDAHWKKSFVEAKLASMRGILRIENLLAVVPSQKVADERIAESIVRALERDSDVDADDITVEVSDGVVTLLGTVPTWSARRAAESDASRTVGVVDVHNELTLAA